MPYCSEVLTYQTTGSNIKLRKRSIKTPLDPYFIVVRVACVSLSGDDAVRKALTWVPWFGGHAVGQEFSGIVEIAGAFSNFATGDRVCGYVDSWDGSFVGTYALINVKKNFVSKIPDSLSDVEAASIPRAFMRAASILRKLKPNRYSRVLVIGAMSPLGLMVIQLAKLEYGVAFIAAIGEECGWLRQIGADVVCSQEDVGVCCPSGFTAVIDTCSSGIRSEIPVGNYYTAMATGSYTSRIQLPYKLIRWLYSEVTEHSTEGTEDPEGTEGSISSEGSASRLKSFFDHHSAAQCPLDHVYGVEEVNQAWGRMIDGAKNKVVIRLTS